MNRRNYYRVLHVQPDAPIEVVRAAYRALMARHHPDQGGDHHQAVLLNEAWAVLGEPSRRAAYDEKRQRAGQRPRAGAEQRGQTASSRGERAASPPPSSPPPSSPSSRPAGAGCPFCSAVPASADLVCARCTAPLTRVKPAAPRPGASGAGTPGAPAGAADGADERRRLPRVSRADWGTMKLHWQGDAIDVRLRNLSLEGVSFFSGAPLAAGARVRVSAAAFDAIVDVIRCSRSGAIYVAQGAFVTVRFAGKGGFVYTTA